MNIMERDIMAALVRWKKGSNRKPLVVTGVRQCGKTYILQEFGTKHFNRVIYVNLEKDGQIADAFSYDYNVSRIVDEISIIKGIGKISYGDTLLILDEIQACPRAITSLKYFCEDLPQLHVVCAGSLLGVAIKHKSLSFPVGKIDRLRMYPMSFKEFMVSFEDGNKLIKLLENYAKDRILPDATKALLESYYRKYLLIGGMPEVVQNWNTSHSFEEVNIIQDRILNDYRDDFSKHAPLEMVAKLHWIWDSVPKQLAKENNKFVFSQVKAGKRAHELEDALQWLVDAGLVYRTELVSEPQMPLAYAANSSYFKIYLADVGLLCRRSGMTANMILQNNDLLANFRGALTENYVHNELQMQNIVTYFWRSGNSAEVDFIIENECGVIPLEVKSADNTRAKSYANFCKKYHIAKGFKISLKNIAATPTDYGVTINLPLYLLWKIMLY